MIRVLIADDSATTRRFLIKILTEGNLIEVVGQASSGREAVDLAKELKPDVITMDIVMPGLNGVDATAQIMASNPTPIIIVSAMEDVRRSTISMDALNAGALAILALPSLNSPDLNAIASHIRETVVNVVKVKSVRLEKGKPLVAKLLQKAPALKVKPNRALRDILAGRSRLEIVCIAGSVGGPAALATILSELPVDFPLPILITQHISKGFTGDLARWLDNLSPIKVKVAEDGEPLKSSTAFIAPDNYHLGVRGRGNILLSVAAPINGFRPAASFMYDSVARVFKGQAVAVILTGMGSDGLSGLTIQKEVGGIIIAQDEATSVVYGMPKAAVENGLTDLVLPLESIAAYLTTLTQQNGLERK
ncbi:MAG: chemotaxis-specific protein-glutamate methyltransferase CheB [Cyanobacteria bacterium REEB67]|nr:chemotaxis-specific protein-glutamate methyltransferase CheB [Cyanobacteria bacterium REEB67]